MIARSLGALGDAALFGRGLDLALSEHLSATELVEAFLYAASRDETRPWALAWLDGHFRELRHILDASLLLDLASLLGETCDAPTRDSAYGFFSSAFQTMDGQPRRLLMFKELADRCIAGRAK